MPDKPTPDPEPVFLDPYDHDCNVEGVRQDLQTLIAAVVIMHNTEHDGAYQWCSHALCRVANDL